MECDNTLLNNGVVSKGITDAKVNLLNVSSSIFQIIKALFMVKKLI